MIEVEDISYSYDGARDALSHVSLTLRDGEVLAVLGGNGSGKSTLARHLNALLVPDEGRVTVDGLDTARPELAYAVRSHVGMVFQNPDDQLVATLVEDDVAFGPENMGVPSAEIGERVRTVLKAVGLVGFERHETHALSGGQKQRVAIAGALAMEPRVLVLDEATSMLDPRGRAGLMRVIRELKARGMAVVMITHDMEEAAEADRVIVLDGGRVALEGTPAEVFAQSARLMALGLAVPASVRLAMALRDRGVEVPVLVDEDAEVEAVARAVAGDGVRPEHPVAVVAAPQAEVAVYRTPSSDDGADSNRTAGEPLVELDRVFYSYAVSPRERKRLARRGAVAAAGKDRAAWGNDPASVWALEDVSLTIRRGELLGIAGHTGSGKSTLVQHLNGLLAPTQGRVTALGVDLSQRHATAALKGRVGVVFQYPERQLFAATVVEDVAFGPRNLGLDEAEVDARVRAALKRVGLDVEELGGKSPFALSGGQQRRVAFAGVLAMEPEVLVLDEPAAGLDPAAHRDMLALVRGLHAAGTTVVMVSHNMDDLAELCDRIVIMDRGRIYREGTPHEVFADADALKEVGLGLPAGERLARKLADRGIPVSEGHLHDIEGLADGLAALVHVAPAVDAPAAGTRSAHFGATSSAAASSSGRGDRA